MYIPSGLQYYLTKFALRIFYQLLSKQNGTYKCIVYPRRGCGRYMYFTYLGTFRILNLFRLDMNNIHYFLIHIRDLY